MGAPVRDIVLLVYSWVLGRTKLGRYIYAIGANPEAARRAGINVNLVKTIGFVLARMTAGFAGFVYESQQGSIATDINGGQYVLYAVAAAVIGGTSLFGGKGKMLHALIGGILIATVLTGLPDGNQRRRSGHRHRDRARRRRNGRLTGQAPRHRLTPNAGGPGPGTSRSCDRSAVGGRAVAGRPSGASG